MEAKRRKVEESRTNSSVSEADVGITEFVSPELTGFVGLIKQRYSDFQVNEIDLEGKVVTLTSIDVPEEEKPAETPQPSSTKEPISDNEFSKALAKIVGEDTVKSCLELANGSQDINKVRTKPISDKELRTEVHKLVRDAFESRLDSKTDDGLILITRFTSKSKRNARRNVGRGSREAEFLHFTLYKENKDTLEALSLIAKMLHIPPKSMTFAGTKDRRAVTTQRICWKRGNAVRLMNLNKAFKTKNVMVGDFSFENRTIKLGDLTGNQFRIVIRDVKKEALENVDASLSSLRDNGFINYFGLQRFGTFSVSSHTIGRYIIGADYDKVVDSILGPQSITLEDSREARQVWSNEHNAEKALELMPRRCAAECAMLTALKESDNSLNAVLRIPYSLKTMYVHAYQSYIWNRAASERIRLEPRKVLAGDLVLSEVTDRGVQRAREVTEEEIKDGSVSIFDVVLPSPGNDVTYPTNLVSFYEKIMAEDGLDCHNMSHKIKEFSLFGSYRQLLAKPLRLEWTTRKYLNDDDDILRTDREIIEGHSRFADEPTDDSEEARTAIVLELGLATSQYATMAIREATKQETSRNGKIYFA